jgi:hypothetical protein
MFNLGIFIEVLSMPIPVIYDPVLSQFRGWETADGPFGDQSYVHTQTNPSVTWTITHNLGTKALDIVLFNSVGDRIYADPDYAGASSNSIAVNFSEPVSGTAYVRSL